MKRNTVRQIIQAPDGGRLISVAEASREFNVNYESLRARVIAGELVPWTEIGTIVLVRAEDVANLTGVTPQSSRELQEKTQ
jgi:hypothetical protein